MLRLLPFPTCLRHLVCIVLGRDNADEISSYHGLFCSKCHGKIRAVVQVVGGGMRTHGNHDLLCVPLTAPSSIHSIGLAVLVVCADNQYWLWKHPRFLSE